eukprot:2675358-Rhodomonas_salina.2
MPSLSTTLATPLGLGTPRTGGVASVVLRPVPDAGGYESDSESLACMTKSCMPDSSCMTETAGQ